MGKPPLKRREATAAFTAFHFAADRCVAWPEKIDINIVSAAAEVACTAERISLGMNAEGLVTIDYLKLDTRAFTTVRSATHADTRSGSPWRSCASSDAATSSWCSSRQLVRRAWWTSQSLAASSTRLIVGSPISSISS